MMEDAASALDCGCIGANARRTGARLVTTTPSAVSRRGGPLCAKCCNPGARKACDHCAGVLYCGNACAKAHWSEHAGPCAAAAQAAADQREEEARANAAATAAGNAAAAAAGGAALAKSAAAAAARGLQRGQWLLPLLQPPLPPLQPQSHRVQPLLRRRQQHRCSRGGSQGQLRRRRPPPPLRVPKQQRG